MVQRTDFSPSRLPFVTLPSRALTQKTSLPPSRAPKIIMDVAAIDAMEPNARVGYLGNGLYPHIATLVGESLAGKVTGMLLEMSTADIVELLQDYEKLKTSVSDAVAALPPDMLDMLGESAAPPPASPASAGPSPTSIMAPEASWADCDEDDECLPSVGDLMAANERKRASKLAPLPMGGMLSAEGGVAMDTDVAMMDMGDAEDGFVCDWDFAQMLSADSEAVCVFIAQRLNEPQVRSSTHPAPRLRAPQSPHRPPRPPTPTPT